MEEILRRIKRQIIKDLSNESKSILLINSVIKSIGKKELKSILIEDRIPSKNYDFIFINFEKEIEKYNIEKLYKYFNKFNKYLFILTNNTQINNKNIKNYPHIKFKFDSSQIIDYYKTFLGVSNNYKEFDIVNKNLLEEMKENLYELGIINIDYKNNDIDGILFFKSDELKNEFITNAKSLISITKINNFYNKILKEYSLGIDNRNIRFQKNIGFLTSKVKRLLSKSKSNLTNSSKSTLSAFKNSYDKTTSNIKKITNKDTKIIKTLPKENRIIKNEEHIPSKEINKPKINKFLVQFNRLKANLYIRKNIKQSKFISYEEYLGKNNSNTIRTMMDNRTMQKFKNNPKISILVVIDDIDELWLNKSVRTIKEQTYKKWELVIVDNCSSRTYIKSYLSALNDPRIKTHFYDVKRTYSECLNTAYKISKGDFITSIQEGDEIDSKALFYCVQELNKDNSLEILYPDEDRINEQGRKVSPFFKSEWDKTMILSYPYAQNLAFFKREFIDRVSGLKARNTKFPIWDLLLKARNTTENIKHIDEIIYHKRILPLKKKYNDIYDEETVKNYLLKESVVAEVKPSKEFNNSFYILKPFNKKVSIIIINTSNILNFLDNFNILYKNFDIHIGTVNHLEIKKEYPFKTTIHTFDDFNYANIVNSIAQTLDSDYLLFLDSRLNIDNDLFLNILTSYVDENNIVGTKILDTNELVQYSFYIKNYKGPVSTFLEGTSSHNKFDVSVSREVSAISKRCFLINKDLFLKFKFDDAFCYNYQDIDLCFNVIENGGKVIFVPDAKLHTRGKFQKENFNETDTARFIDKWNNLLKIPDTHINVNIYSTIRVY